jgi:hypothetical protein
MAHSQFSHGYTTSSRTSNSHVDPLAAEKSLTADGVQASNQGQPRNADIMEEQAHMARTMAAKIMQEAAREWGARNVLSRCAQDAAAVSIQAQWRGFAARHGPPPPAGFYDSQGDDDDDDDDDEISLICMSENEIQAALPLTVMALQSLREHDAANVLREAWRRYASLSKRNIVFESLSLGEAPIVQPSTRTRPRSPEEGEGQVVQQHIGISPSSTRVATTVLKARNKLRGSRTSKKKLIGGARPPPISEPSNRSEAMEACANAAWGSACVDVVLSANEMMVLADALGFPLTPTARGHDVMMQDRAANLTQFSLPLDRVAGGSTLADALTVACRMIGVDEEHLPVGNHTASEAWVALSAMITAPFGAGGPAHFLTRHEGVVKWTRGEVKAYLGAMNLPPGAVTTFEGDGLSALRILLSLKGKLHDGLADFPSLMRYRLQYHVHAMAWAAVWERVGSNPEPGWSCLARGLCAVLAESQIRRPLQRKQQPRRKKRITKRVGNPTTSRSSSPAMVQSPKPSPGRRAADVKASAEKSLSQDAASIRKHKRRSKSVVESLRSVAASGSSMGKLDKVVVVPDALMEDVAEDTSACIPLQYQEGGKKQKKRPLYRPRETAWAGQGRVLWSGEPAVEDEPLQINDEGPHEGLQSLPPAPVEAEAIPRPPRGSRGIPLAVTMLKFTGNADQIDLRAARAASPQPAKVRQPSWRPAGSHVNPILQAAPQCDSAVKTLRTSTSKAAQSISKAGTKSNSGSRLQNARSRAASSSSSSAHCHTTREHRKLRSTEDCSRRVRSLLDRLLLQRQHSQDFKDYLGAAEVSGGTASVDSDSSSSEVDDYEAPPPLYIESLT